MATPQESTTTVSGRRCTRSRARTAATSTTLTSEEPAVTSIDLPTSTIAPETTEIQSTTTEVPPPPPPSSSSTEDAQQAPPTESAFSTTGTSSVASPSVTQSSVLANVAAAPPPAAAAPIPATEVNETEAVVAAQAESSTTEPPTTSSSTSSDSIATAATSTSSLSTSTSSAVTSTQSAAAVLPEDPTQSEVPSESVSSDQPEQSQTQPEDPPTQPEQSQTDPEQSQSQPEQSLTPPEQAQPTDTGIPPGGEAGIIAPNDGPPEGSNSLTLPANGEVNVAGIAGGVAGGFVAIALVSALLFFCLRKRKSGGKVEKWQPQLNEKNQGGGALSAKIKAIPAKLKAMSAGIGMFVAKLKGKKAGPSSHPYRRHTMRSSVSSVYSNRRSQSISEPPSKLRQQLRGFGDRMPSLKRSKTLLQKKPDSLVVGDKSPFPNIVDDPVLRNSKGTDNPFADPEEPPKNLFLLNPDPSSPNPRKSRVDGLADQQRGPLTPKPTAKSERNSKDDFASILDELDKRNGSGTPEWFQDTTKQHKRTTSAQTALRSHPPSTYTASIYTTAENPFFDPYEAPPVPTQPLPPNPPSRPANAYAPLPAFNATSSTVSRDSNASFYFGEPGPSRPNTNMYTSRVRQSDPFDLDRPEVLGFGNVNGRTVRGSVTRQNSRNRRSNVPNYVSVSDGPYERSSAVPGPLRNTSVKR